MISAQSRRIIDIDGGFILLDALIALFVICAVIALAAGIIGAAQHAYDRFAQSLAGDLERREGLIDEISESYNHPKW